MTDDDALIALAAARKLVWGEAPHTKRTEISDAIDKAAARIAALTQRVAELSNIYESAEDSVRQAEAALAERDGLLREARCHLDGEGIYPDIVKRIDAAIASAKP